jgi:hypothetical protein
MVAAIASRFSFSWLAYDADEVGPTATLPPKARFTQDRENPPACEF